LLKGLNREQRTETLTVTNTNSSTPCRLSFFQTGGVSPKSIEGDGETLDVLETYAVLQSANIYLPDLQWGKKTLRKNRLQLGVSNDNREEKKKEYP